MAAVALLSGLVFYASLKNEEEKTLLNGPGPSPDGEVRTLSLEDLKKLNLQTHREAWSPPGIPPQTSEALKTIEEINRINRLNAESRQRTENAPRLPAAPKEKN